MFNLTILTSNNLQLSHQSPLKSWLRCKYYSKNDIISSLLKYLKNCITYFVLHVLFWPYSRKAGKLINWSAKTSLDFGPKKTFLWFKKNNFKFFNLIIVLSI